jgi:pimeloyl-ACP methyl ester carboxylesterase
MSTRLVILPGIDGTAFLREEFVRSVNDLNPVVVSYPEDLPQDYPRLADAALSQLPQNEPYYLLGESFGGPLAILLAQREGCVGLILSASFYRYTSHLRALAPLSNLLSPNLLPSSLVSWFLLGEWATPLLRSQVSDALAKVSSHTLRARMQASLRVDLSAELRALRTPLLYMQASKDRIVPASVGRGLANASTLATLIQIPGPHLLLQVAPNACATEIRQFVSASML